MDTAITYVDNDTMICITVTEDGFVESGYVSSMHLVDTKVKQLHESLRRRAASSLNPVCGR